jgi:glutathione S-transferase
VFVHGWRPSLRRGPPPPDGYALQPALLKALGLHYADESAATRGELPRPVGRLVLYEFDSSPFCRKVRDAAAILDLELEIRPCPGAGGQRGGACNQFSDDLFARTGRRTVPYLIDEGRDLGLFESERIVSHLYDAYGPGASRAPAMLRGSLALVSAGCAAVVRGMPAAKLQIDARAENAKMAPLRLYGYEGSPFCHPVREKLCALGLPHTLVNCARGSARRAELSAQTDLPFQVPYLIDPNTGVRLHESIEIRMYLDRTYTTSGYTPLRGGSYAGWPGSTSD